MSTKSRFILGLIGAAAVGAVVGLMLAPEKGTDLRKRVGKTAGDWAGHITDLFSNAKDEVNNLKSKGTKVAGEAGNKFNNMKENFS